MLIIKRPALLNLLLLLGISWSISFQSAFAAEVCPAINCDCSNLPSEPWLAVCLAHETNLKKQCAKNGNVPTDFCSLHGPSATPLPMVLTFGEVAILPRGDIKETHERADTMFWSLHTDMKVIAAMVKKKLFGEAQATLKTVGRNLDALFSLQRQVTSSYVFHDRLSDSQKAWKDYSNKSLKEAEFMFEIGQRFWEQGGESKAKEQKAYRVLSMKVLRMSSQAYEMAAIAGAGAGEDTDAANAWKGASNVSRTIMAYKIEHKANPKHVEYYRKQTAMRLHRASYHWMMSEDEASARNSLQASVEFMENKAELNMLLRKEGATNEVESTKSLVKSR